MREGFDGHGFVGVLRGDVLENVLWFQGGTALRSTCEHSGFKTGLPGIPHRSPIATCVVFGRACRR